MCFGVCGWLRRNRAPFGAGELRLQGFGDVRGNVAFDGENIGQFAIVSLGPKMGITFSIDKLDTDSHLIGRLLDGAFQDIRDTELFRDLRNVVGCILES